MKIQLNWQIEAERVGQQSGEDPQMRGMRRRRMFQFIFLAVIVASTLIVLAVFVWLRLSTVDNVLRSTLNEVAQAEVSALRIGDYSSFISFQRSANDDWFAYQGAQFQRYQDLKTQNKVELTGKIVDTTIDGQRGRVIIEEQREGRRHQSVWFYWRYPDGWRHVPSDFTFWGDPQQIKGKVATLTFRELDRALAVLFAERIDRWWAEGCALLACAKPLPLSVDIRPDPNREIAWEVGASASDLTLVIPSPLSRLDGTDAEQVLSATLEDAVAQQLADRLFVLVTNGLQPAPTADAAWLKQSVISWMSGLFTTRSDPQRASFMQTLNDNYGELAVSQLVAQLTPTSDINVLTTVTNQPLGALIIDWRSFFQWRLEIEKTLLTNNQVDAAIALWDVGNPSAQPLLQQRLQQPGMPTPQIQSVAISTGADGVPVATMQASSGETNLLVMFRLVNGTWKRAG